MDLDGPFGYDVSSSPEGQLLVVLTLLTRRSQTPLGCERKSGTVLFGGYTRRREPGKEREQSWLGTTFTDETTK